MKQINNFRFPVDHAGIAQLRLTLYNLSAEQRRELDDNVWDSLSTYDYYTDLNHRIESGEIIIYQGDNGYGFVFGDWSEEEKQAEINDMAEEGGRYSTIEILADELHECLYPQPDLGDSEY